MEDGGELIAGVLYDNFNGQSICMHVASVPGKRWATREFLRMCFDYPFRQLGVKKVLGLVDSKNQPALDFDHHIGFVTEAVIQDAGSSGDLHILTMTPDQCRFLG